MNEKKTYDPKRLDERNHSGQLQTENLSVNYIGKPRKSRIEKLPQRNLRHKGLLLIYVRLLKEIKTKRKDVINDKIYKNAYIIPQMWIDRMLKNVQNTRIINQIYQEKNDKQVSGSDNWRRTHSKIWNTEVFSWRKYCPHYVRHTDNTTKIYPRKCKEVLYSQNLFKKKINSFMYIEDIKKRGPKEIKNWKLLWKR